MTELKGALCNDFESLSSVLDRILITEETDITSLDIDLLMDITQIGRAHV